MLKKIIKTTTFLTILAWVILMNSCMNFRKSDRKTLKYFDKKKVTINIHRTSHNNHKVRFIETGCSNNDCPIVLFVHGAPGASDAYFDFLEDLELQKKAKLVSVDRLGYGYSNYGQSETAIYEQATVLKTVLQQYNNSSVILVGHSYGAPIVARYAMEYPDYVKALLLVSPVIDPDSEKIFWFAHFGRWKMTRWMLSKAFRVAADEKFSHIEELQKMVPDWEKLEVPVVHMHGKKDKLASFDNIAFGKTHIPNNLLKTVELERANHLFIFSQVQIVKDELLLLLEDLKNSETF